MHADADAHRLSLKVGRCGPDRGQASGGSAGGASVIHSSYFERKEDGPHLSGLKEGCKGCRVGRVGQGGDGLDATPLEIAGSALHPNAGHQMMRFLEATRISAAHHP